MFPWLKLKIRLFYVKSITASFLDTLAGFCTYVPTYFNVVSNHSENGYSSRYSSFAIHLIDGLHVFGCCLLIPRMSSNCYNTKN